MLTVKIVHVAERVVAIAREDEETRKARINKGFENFALVSPRYHHSTATRYDQVLPWTDQYLNFKSPSKLIIKKELE